MEIDIFDTEKFIKINNLKEVTNPIPLERDHIPTIDGLLSYDIFGRTTQDRSETFAYIKLNGHFLHPLVYNTWKRMNRKIEGVVSGSVKVIIDSKGELVVDEENGWTGLEELYKHFDQLKFKISDSNIQNERNDFLRVLKKEEIFVESWLIMPAFFRDIQLAKADKGKISIHVITEIYSKILRLTNGLKTDVTGIEMIGHSTRNRIQTLLQDLYSDELMGSIKGKNGKFRKDVIGKSVDYGCRLVISAPLFNVDKSEDMLESFEYAGVPLAACCTCFFPFILKWLKDYFYKEIYLLKDKYPIRNKVTKEIEYVRLKNVDKFSDEFLTKAVDSFIHSYSDRFKNIELEIEGRNDTVKMFIFGQYTDEKAISRLLDSTIINRPLTWTDLLYRAAVDVCKDRHMIFTRYPLEDYFGRFQCKITVISTIKTAPALISGKIYKNYPIIPQNISKIESSTLFRDSLSISNLYLQGLGGDYDGDQLSARGIWFDESNKEAHDSIYQVNNLLSITGDLVRSTEKEAIQTFYNLS